MRPRWNFHRSGLRSPRTTQELRRNTSPEEKMFVRGKRRKHQLPTVYDDLPLPYFPNYESWKRLRHHQYKER